MCARMNSPAWRPGLPNLSRICKSVRLTHTQTRWFVPSMRYSKALFWIPGELETEAAPRPASLWTDEPLHQVLAVLPEDLYAVATAVGHIDQTVLRADDAMKGGVLLRGVVWP